MIFIMVFQKKNDTYNDKQQIVIYTTKMKEVLCFPRAGKDCSL